jgi:hypothetical protein
MSYYRVPGDTVEDTAASRDWTRNLRGGFVGEEEATSPEKRRERMSSARTNRLPKGIIFMLFGLLVLAAVGWPQSASAMRHHRWSVGLEIEIGDYDYLSDYGEWVRLPGFGTVWHPYAVSDWAPFHHGHWIYTDGGWAWASYEPFGWLVYHYGYWYHDWSIGWFWVPGRIWSPAQVEWYTFGDYCAWAPLPPPSYRWRDPWDRNYGFNVWFVVNINNFCDDEIWRHRVADPPRREVYKRSVLMKRAPAVRDVERFTKREIAPVRITRERVERRQEVQRAPAKYTRPREIERKKMVLPEREADRVKQYAPRVEREVLVPKEKAPRQEQQRPQQTNEKQRETRQKEQQQKKTVRGR